MAKYAPDISKLAAWQDGRVASWARSGLKLGLFGGSFNPAHGGHHHVAVSAMRLLGLDAVIWLVAPQNPLKTSDDMADYERRLNRAREVADHPRMAVSDIERRLDDQFTAETIRDLRRRFPRARFVWLMGADSFINFHRWRHWRGIMLAVPIAILPRPGAPLAAAKARAGRQMAHGMVALALAGKLASMAPPAWTVLTAELDKRSATAIRARGEWP